MVVAHHWSSQAAKVMRPRVGVHPGASALGVFDLDDEALGVDPAGEGLAALPAGRVAVARPVSVLTTNCPTGWYRPAASVASSGGRGRSVRASTRPNPMSWSPPAAAGPQHPVGRCPDKAADPRGDPQTHRVDADARGALQVADPDRPRRHGQRTGRPTPARRRLQFHPAGDLVTIGIDAQQGPPRVQQHPTGHPHRPRRPPSSAAAPVRPPPARRRRWWQPSPPWPWSSGTLRRGCPRGRGAAGDRPPGPAAPPWPRRRSVADHAWARPRRLPGDPVDPSVACRPCAAVVAWVRSRLHRPGRTPAWPTLRPGACGPDARP